MEREFDLFSLMVFVIKRKFILLIGLVLGLCSAFFYRTIQEENVSYQSTATYNLQDDFIDSQDQIVAFASATNKALQTESSLASIIKGVEENTLLTQKNGFQSQIGKQALSPINLQVDDVASKLSISIISANEITSRDEVIKMLSQVLDQTATTIQNEHKKAENTSDYRSKQMSTWKFITLEKEIFYRLSKIAPPQNPAFSYIYSESNAIHRNLAALAVLEENGNITSSESKEFKDLIFRFAPLLTTLTVRPDDLGFNPDQIKSYFAAFPTDRIETRLAIKVKPQIANINLRFLLIILACSATSFALAAALEFYELNRHRLKRDLKKVNEHSAKQQTQ